MTTKTETPNRHADAVWKGGIKDGKGQITLGSNVFSGTYSYDTRFSVGEGTTPEELLAAAHAACFTMATSGGLSKAGHPPESLETNASVTMEMQSGGPLITEIKLVIKGKVPGMTDEQFKEIAAEAKKNCPLSKALASVPTITLEASLVS